MLTQAASEIQAVQNLQLPFQHPFPVFSLHTHTEAEQQIPLAPPAERLEPPNTAGTAAVTGQGQGSAAEAFHVTNPFLKQGLTRPCTATAALLHPSPPTQTQPCPSARPALGAGQGQAR